MGICEVDDTPNYWLVILSLETNGRQSISTYLPT